VLARPRSRRAETPPAATRQHVRGRGPLGVRMRPRHRHPSPEPYAGPPQPPERWPSHPPGGISPPTQRHGSHVSSRTMANGKVVVRSAPRATRAISPEHAGTERASRGGVSLAWSLTNSEGAQRGTFLLGRMRRRVGGLGSRPSPSDRSRPAGQKKTSTEWKTKHHPGTRGTGKERGYRRAAERSSSRISFSARVCESRTCCQAASALATSALACAASDRPGRLMQTFW